MDVYLSKEGYTNLPLQRGFEDIQTLFTALGFARAYTGDNCFICGGYARYCASPRPEPTPANDVDVYCETEKVYKYLVELFSNLTVKHENEVSITYEPHDMYKGKIIQLIKPLSNGAIVTTGTRKNVLDNFDFTVVRACIISEDTVLVDADFEHDERQMLLRLKNIHCPVSSLLRCTKYAKKGYYLPPMHALALFEDWDNRSEDYKEKLKTFLTSSRNGEELSQEQIDELEAMLRID